MALGVACRSGDGLGGNLVAAAGDAVGAVDVDQLRRVLGQFDLVIHGEGGDDEDVAGGGPARGGAVDGNDPRSPLGADGVGGEALAVIDVPDVDLLVLADIGGVEQIFVDGAGTLVVQFGMGRGDPVKLGFQHRSLHGLTIQGWGWGSAL